MTKLKSKTGKEFHTKWIEFLISTVRLFHSFVQYGKKVFLKDFVLDKEGLITEADMDLKE